MIQTDINSNEKTNISMLSSEPRSVTWTRSSFTPIHASDKPCTTNDITVDTETQNLSSSSDYCNNNTDDENIDWDFVTKQLESKLRRSVNIFQSASDENDQQQQQLSSKIPKKYRFRPITNQETTVTEQVSSSTSHNNDNIILHSIIPLSKQNPTPGDDNQMETNTCRLPNKTSSTSTLHDLFNELTICQQKQMLLIEQIQQHLIKPTEQISSSSHALSSSAFFLPINSLTEQETPSLQDAFQQRKSSFIQQSKQRLKDISRQKIKHHQRIIPHIQQTNNTYLQERRQYEYDRLCAMIIKHQNRQNAKIYGNLIKKSIVSSLD